MTDYSWSTEKSHSDNTETMTDYIENHMPSFFTLLFQDGSYAEVFDEDAESRIGLHASGRGDFNNHKITFEIL